MIRKRHWAWMGRYSQTAYFLYLSEAEFFFQGRQLSSKMYLSLMIFLWIVCDQFSQSVGRFSSIPCHIRRWISCNNNTTFLTNAKQGDKINKHKEYGTIVPMYLPNSLKSLVTCNNNNYLFVLILGREHRN